MWLLVQENKLTATDYISTVQQFLIISTEKGRQSKVETENTEWLIEAQREREEDNVYGLW